MINDHKKIAALLHAASGNSTCSLTAIAPMKIKSDECLILGITAEGRSFRPSDWAERLCGVLAGYDSKRRWIYSDYAQPVIHEGQIGVKVKTALQTINPDTYEFIMNFAYRNQLKIVFEETIHQDESAAATEITQSVQKLTLALLIHQWKIRFPFKYFGL
ncbi:uncharacterized protein DUF3579 [Nitrosomonas sp. Nm84]|uniref:DUF3579 domain-containing protein n=1 Tax=Nitrosomonas sp. Nm84 TaxID=200124 RepID=UPI000D879BB2|nr:DUF3579 domain-containing protein [Nitrosomonas sp. Nm84]PXW87788.1 uncharacterized protein DUF3579 [Nitrosomonas sp. Nm84]